MSYKSRMCYVVLRSSVKQDDPRVEDIVPVAVFYDQETAEGNAEGYNLDMQERNVPGIRFYVAVTCAYE